MSVRCVSDGVWWNIFCAALFFFKYHFVLCPLRISLCALGTFGPNQLFSTQILHGSLTNSSARSHQPFVHGASFCIVLSINPPASRLNPGNYSTPQLVHVPQSILWVAQLVTMMDGLQLKSVQAIELSS